MTYSVYGYCSWECLMNKRGRTGPSPRNNKKTNTNRNSGQNRTKWV